MKTLLLSLVVLINIASFGQAQKVKTHINHVAIFVVDLGRTNHFYQDMFALDTIPEPFHDKRHTWYSLGSGVAMHVIQVASKEKEYYQNQHICLSIDAVEPFVEKLNAKNITYYNAVGVKGQITNRIDGVKQVWIQDPDGYWLEINDARN